MKRPVLLKKAHRAVAVLGKKQAQYIYWPEDTRPEGTEADTTKAIAIGFEMMRPQTAIVIEGKKIVWTERCLFIRSKKLCCSDTAQILSAIR
ncbi:MAG: hypothetical protein M5U34_37925 [Chloroflexi bacterium]|nr:hypothetical protein [Chloroflexota bacterium]